MWALFSESVSIAGQSRFWVCTEISKSSIMEITLSIAVSPLWSSCEGSIMVYMITH